MNNIQDVIAFFQRFRNYKLYQLQGLQKFVNDMKLDVTVKKTDDYLSVRKAFQNKYGIYMAFIEGNHRMTTAGLIIRNFPISADIHSDNYMNDIENIDTLKEKFKRPFTTWIHKNYDCSLLDPTLMESISSNINL